MPFHILFISGKTKESLGYLVFISSGNIEFVSLATTIILPLIESI